MRLARNRIIGKFSRKSIGDVVGAPDNVAPKYVMVLGMA
jgi:hypothetical protein